MLQAVVTGTRKCRWRRQGAAADCTMEGAQAATGSSGGLQDSPRGILYSRSALFVPRSIECIAGAASALQRLASLEKPSDSLLQLRPRSTS